MVPAARRLRCVERGLRAAAAGPSSAAGPSVEQEGYATTESGARLYYRHVGDPSHPTVLLIMGTGLDHSQWDGQVPAYVAAGFRCLVYDNRGSGRTRTKNPAASPRCLAELRGCCRLGGAARRPAEHAAHGG